MSFGRPARENVLTGRGVFLIFCGFFGIIIAVNAGLTFAALRSWSGAETSSAYRAGQLFNTELEAARRQEARGWTLATVVRRQDGDGLVAVEARDRSANPLRGVQLRVTLERPADQRLDRSATLVEISPGRHEARLADLAAGQWDVIVDVREEGMRAFRRRSRILLP